MKKRIVILLQLQNLSRPEMITEAEQSDQHCYVCQNRHQILILLDYFKQKSAECCPVILDMLRLVRVITMPSVDS